MQTLPPLGATRPRGAWVVRWKALFCEAVAKMAHIAKAAQL